MNPTVSVVIYTYNHKSFITQTIESVLMQQTNFELEIIVGDDASNDGTSEILNNFAKQYPEKIKVYIHANNLGPKGLEGKNNFLFVLNKCTAKYIALLDGDDYWTDPLKLQKQVDFLENNPKYSGVFHNIINRDESTKNESVYYTTLPLNKNEFNTDDLLKNWIIHLTSLVFRKDTLVIPDFFREIIAGDVALVVLLSDKALIYYINDVMSVYRSHSGGITKIFNKTIHKIIKYRHFYLTQFDLYFNYRYTKTIRRQLQWDNELGFNDIKNNSFKIKYTLLLLKYFFRKEYYNAPQGNKNLLIFMINSIFPRVYNYYAGIKIKASKKKSVTHISKIKS